MTKAAALEFLSRAESDPAVRAELDTIEARSREEALARVVAVARRHGHPIDGAALAAAIPEFLGEALDDHELDRVAGGGAGLDDLGWLLRRLAVRG